MIRLVKRAGQIKALIVIGALIAKVASFLSRLF